MSIFVQHMYGAARTCEVLVFVAKKVWSMNSGLKVKSLLSGLPLTRLSSHGVFSGAQGVLIKQLNGSSRYKGYGVHSGESPGSKYGAIITKTQGSTLDRPVVVILGWNSSRGKHLKKYSKIFEAKNFDSICVPANPLNTFFRAGTKVKKISLHILDLLVELNCQRRPVFLYAFSNGGCAMFFHIMEGLSYPTDSTE
ncbi:transmembrane protein 53-like [Orbicella faveolata]|uniref:transmembrane protein 53-like n=1 Tax=Orbicella faveolata TaxID=48498 RepID=UPI0009E20D24|nr:transmembrane protein 53-like [Orbicella faveolata]